MSTTDPSAEWGRQSSSLYLPGIEILVVCTGNTCRSPLVAAWLEHLLDDRFSVSSAGLLGWNERPASPHAVTVAEARGIDLTAHRSRRLEGALVQRADLVLAMTRQHAWGVAAHEAAAASRTFLLPEVVRLARTHGPRGTAALRNWSDGLAVGRDHRHPGRAQDELADPAGLPLATYETLADRVAPLVEQLAIQLG